MNKLKLFLILIFVPHLCWATEHKPWFGNEYEAELRATLLYQNYDSYGRDANDLFTTLSAAYPFRRYCGEFEVTAAHTHHQNHRIDNFRITGRYLWLDDTDSDPYSLVTGITITEPLSRALHDISSFHHGHIEGEVFLSAGKKYGYPCSADYLFRWWNVIGVGVADESCAWFREDAAFEYNYDDVHFFRGFMNSSWGTGNHRLHPHDFKGYGNIQHRSIDLGLRYSYNSCWGTFSIQYERRVYAHNFPKNANLVLFEYYLPIGNQTSITY